jgi:hypothetical protein
MSEKVERTFSAFASRAAQSGRAIPMMLAAVSTYHAGMLQVVVAGDPSSAHTRTLARATQRRFNPAAIVIPVAPRHHDAMARLLPWLSAMRPQKDQATAYVCREFACLTPTTSADELVAQMAQGKSR